MEARKAEEPLFLSKQGKRLETDNLVNRHLKPILKKLGLNGGAHAFRHGNATMPDSVRASLKVRQDRLGHAGLKTAMLYTHSVSDEQKRTAEQLGCRLEEGFLSQDYPRLSAETETASEPSSEAIVQ